MQDLHDDLHCAIAAKLCDFSAIYKLHCFPLQSSRAGSADLQQNGVDLHAKQSQP